MQQCIGSFYKYRMPDEIYLGRTATGVDEYLSVDESEQKVHVRSTQDVTPIIELNKELKLLNPGGMTKTGELKHIARIPVNVAQMLCQLHGVNIFAKENKNLLKRILADPDLRHFRTDK